MQCVILLICWGFNLGFFYLLFEHPSGRFKVFMAGLLFPDLMPFRLPFSGSSQHLFPWTYVVHLRTSAEDFSPHSQTSLQSPKEHGYI